MTINQDAYFQDPHSGEDRRIKHCKEFTVEMKENSMRFLKALNAYLDEMGIIGATVSSGWRPPSINAKVKNAAPRSLHVRCLAIDLRDNTGDLKKTILDKEQWLKEHNQPSLLKKYGLWMEHPDHTPTWCHLDQGERSDRYPRVFKP